jgi:putative ABC transport system substrate-binding protein
MAKRKIGFLHSGTEDSFKKPFSAFVRRLKDIIGEENDVKIKHRWAADDTSKTLRQHADALVLERCTAIVAAGGPATALALKAATATELNPTPVIFTSVANPGPPPDGIGLVQSYDAPGGNLTGIAGLTSELDVTRLELLRELIPPKPDEDTPIGVLVNAARPNHDAQYTKLTNEAQALGLKMRFVRKDVVDKASIEQAFIAFKTVGVDKVAAVLVTADSLFNDLRTDVVKFAQGVPTIYQWREFAEAGGLMSYGPDIIDAYELAAEYVADILDGELPTNLPVSIPDRFELVINMKVANKMSNFRIPASLMSRATFVHHRRQTKRSLDLAAEAADQAE